MRGGVYRNMRGGVYRNMCGGVYRVFLVIAGVESIAANCNDPVCIPDNYNRENPPTNDSGGSLKVDARFKIRSIFNVDSYRNTISLSLFLQQTWIDNRVGTSKEGWVGASSKDGWVAVPKHTMDLLWMPKLNFPAMTKMEVGKAFEEQTLLWLKREDNSTWLTFQSDFSLTVTCPMHYSRFPFDSHTCHVLVRSSFLDKSVLVFTMKTKPKWKNNPNIIRDFSVELLELAQDERSVYWDGGQYSLAGFKLKLTRRYSRYIYMYYLPSAMFVLVSWISFLIPPTSYPARVALPITILLVLVNIFNNIITNTPNEADGLTAIAIWIIGTILFVFSVFVGYIIILVNIRRRETNKKLATYVRIEDYEANNNQTNKEDKVKDITNFNFIDDVMLYTMMFLFLMFSLIYGTIIMT